MAVNVSQLCSLRSRDEGRKGCREWSSRIGLHHGVKEKCSAVFFGMDVDGNRPSGEVMVENE